MRVFSLNLKNLSRGGWELESLMETAHLLRSPKNAERLLAALGRAQRNELKPSTVTDLRKQLGLGEEAK